MTLNAVACARMSLGKRLAAASMVLFAPVSLHRSLYSCPWNSLIIIADQIHCSYEIQYSHSQMAAQCRWVVG